MSPTFLDALLRPAHATRLIAAGARPWGPHPLAGPLNLGWVVITNLTMAALVGAQLRTQGVHPARTAAAWLVGLCGGGALAGWLLAPLLLPPAGG